MVDKRSVLHRLASSAFYVVTALFLFSGELLLAPDRAEAEDRHTGYSRS